MRKKKIVDETASGITAGTKPASAAVPQILQTPVRQTAAPRDAQGLDAWPSANAPQDPSWTGDGSVSRTDASQSVSRRSSVALDGHIASADLLNPSDALDLLAHVADLEPGNQDKQSMPSRTANARQEPRDSNLRYPPISDGALGFGDAATLIRQ